MTNTHGLDALALPRSVAFAEGLLVPVAPHLRRAYGIPCPVRFTADAWLSLIAYPGPRGREPSPDALDVRLSRFLTVLRGALNDCRSFLLASHAISITTSPVSVTVVASEDEEGADILTVALPSEANLPC